MITQQLKQANAKPYYKWFRNELNLTNCKVAKWLVWDPDNGDYFADIDSRRVTVPIPVCDWSFLVALHELGHVSTGFRLRHYLMEYNAERWAIKRAKESYGVYSEEYVQEAKSYVKWHLDCELKHTELTIDKVKPYVLEWIEEDVYAPVV